MRSAPAAKPDDRLRKATLLIVFVTVFAALYVAQDVFIPLALAIMVTFVLSPIADWLERRLLPRSAAAVVVITIVCALTLSLAYVVGDQVVAFANDMPKYQSEIANKVTAIRGTGTGFTEKVSKSLDTIEKAATEAGTGNDTGKEKQASDPASQPASESGKMSGGPPPASKAQPSPVTGALAGNTGPEAVPASPREAAVPGLTAQNPLYTVNTADRSNPLSNLAYYAGFVLSPLGTIGLVLVLSLFMLIERDDLRDRLIRLSSTGHRYIVTTQALNDATTRISKFLRAQLIVNGTYGIAISIGLWVIGLTFGGGQVFPSFILFGVLCAVLRFIPYVGPWVAAAFPLAVSLAVFPGFGVFIAVGVMFVIIELLSNNFMEPILYGSSTGISTVALLVAAVLWTFLWGAYGLFLSTPLTVCLVVLGRHVPTLSFLDVLLGDRPALPAGDRFYQRLIANSDADAGVVVNEYAEQRGTIAAADDVIMQAIKIARHDRRTDELTAAEESTLYQSAEKIIDDALAGRGDATAKTAERAGVEAGEMPADVDDANRPLVVALPAHHRAETVAISLLGGLLEPAGARIEALSCSLLPSDMEGRIAETSPAAVFIAVVPPGGATQARYLCRRLRRKFKDLPIVVGYFGTVRDYDSLLVRFRASGASYITTSIGQSRSQLVSLLKLEVAPEVEERQSGKKDKPEARSTNPAVDGQCSPLVAAHAEVRR